MILKNSSTREGKNQHRIYGYTDLQCGDPAQKLQRVFHSLLTSDWHTTASKQRAAPAGTSMLDYRAIEEVSTVCFIIILSHGLFILENSFMLNVVSFKVRTKEYDQCEK